MIFAMGMPIFLLELVIGQYSGQGPEKVFTTLAPLFNGLGYCTLVVITFITIYYMVIIAWTVFYFFASFTDDLGFGSCHNDFNTIGKSTKLLSFFNNTDLAISSVYELDYTTI